jgi:hypothetical protein
MADLVPTHSSGVTPPPYQPGIRRDLARVERQMLTRVAEVQAEGYVDAEKLRELDHLTREALLGHAMTHALANQLAGSDPLLRDALAFYEETARLGRGEILAETVASFCRR